MFRYFRFAALAGWLTLASAVGMAAEPCRVWPAWDQFRGHFVSEGGRVIDRSSAQQVTTSEGQSYALMFALIANDRPAFDLLLRWSRDNLAGGDLTARLPAWQWGQRADGSWGVLDNNAAADADLWMAYALGEAGRLWKNPQYMALAELLAERILREESALLPGLGRALLPGPSGFLHEDTGWQLNPSYLPLQLMSRMAVRYPRSGWDELAASSLQIITAAAPQGFARDWINYRAGKFSVSAPSGPEGGFDAIRVYLWAGMLDAHDPSRAVLLKQFAPMVRRVASDGAPPRLADAPGGADRNSAPAGFSAALLPLLKASGQTAALHQQELRLVALAPFDRADNYYDQVLTLFGQGWLEGRYRFARDGSLKPGWTCAK